MYRVEPAPLLSVFPAWNRVVSLSGVKEVVVSARTGRAQAKLIAKNKQSRRPILLHIALRDPSGASRGAARRKDESHPAPSDNVPRPPVGLPNSSPILADRRILHERSSLFEEIWGNSHWRGRRRSLRNRNQCAGECQRAWIGEWRISTPDSASRS